jgi:hypothetical protein
VVWYWDSWLGFQKGGRAFWHTVPSVFNSQQSCTAVASLQGAVKSDPKYSTRIFLAAHAAWAYASIHMFYTHPPTHCLSLSVSLSTLAILYPAYCSNDSSFPL